MHCCLTWLGKMMILRNNGLSPSAVLKEWNSTCSRNAQLVGNKASALLNLLDLDEPCIDILLRHVSEFGSAGSAFSETIWSVKKIMPNGCPKGFSREWNQRLTMSSEGFLLLLKYCDERHRAKLEGARSKIANQDMEEYAMMAQLLVSLIHEMEKQLPVSAAILQTELYDLFIHGDINLETQLQGALAEKRTSLAPGDLPALKAIMARHLAGQAQKLEALGKATSTISAGQLERQEWDMALASMQHDLDLFKVWLARSHDREAAMYHQGLQWRLSRVNKAKEMAESLMSSTSESGIYHLAVCENASEVSKQVGQIQKKICRLEQISNENLLTVVLVNWSAPNLFSAHMQRTQAMVMGGLCGNSNGTTLGLCIQPTFSFNKGQLHTLEQACSKLLVQANLNLDHSIVLPFLGRNDDREKRSLVMIAKVCMSLDEDIYKAANEKWRSATVFRKPLLDEAELLLTKDILSIEDMSETALPTSTSDSHHPTQAEKAQQCGIPAARSLLRGFLARETTGGVRSATLFVDMTTHTMDFARALILEKGSQAVFYAGFTRDHGELEWSRSLLRDFLSQGMLDGSIKLPPGSTLPPAELPAEMVTSSPPLPNFGSFVVNKGGEGGGVGHIEDA